MFGLFTALWSRLGPNQPGFRSQAREDARSDRLSAVLAENPGHLQCWVLVFNGVLLPRSNADVFRFPGNNRVTGDIKQGAAILAMAISMDLRRANHRNFDAAAVTSDFVLVTHGG